MNGIKVILVTSFLSILVWAFRHRTRVGLRASARLILVAITLAAIASVLMPDITQWAAELVGVTRGTDLVLYLLILVFVTTAVVNYLRFRDLEHRLTLVVRDAALREAAAQHPRPDQTQGASGPE